MHRFTLDRAVPLRPLSARFVVLQLSFAWLAGCAGARLPEIDLSAAEWNVRTGQAVWRPSSSRSPLAGEVILARHAGGDVWIHFSKPPLSIFTARTAGPRWTIDLSGHGRSRSGTGMPPRRFVWFFVPQVLDGAAPPAGWEARTTSDHRWRFRHSERGETIDLLLDP